MLIFKKEKQVVELALRHAETTQECLHIMVAGINALIANDYARLAQSTEQVNRLEDKADRQLRDVRELLYSGAYLPTIRGDIYRLLSRVDSVTNKIEGCLDFANCQKPGSLDNYGDDLHAVLELTENCYAALHTALRAFFKPKGTVEALRESTREVGQIESLIDTRERELITSLFESGLPLAEKLHLEELLARITRISDEIENTADELELLSLKSII